MWSAFFSFFVGLFSPRCFGVLRPRSLKTLFFFNDFRARGGVKTKSNAIHEQPTISCVIASRVVVCLALLRLTAMPSALRSTAAMEGRNLETRVGKDGVEVALYLHEKTASDLCARGRSYRY